MNLINKDKLIEELGIGHSCECCKRNKAGECKGHLSWLCRKIWNAPTLQVSWRDVYNAIKEHH